MAEGTRQARAVEAHGEAKTHSVHRQSSEPTTMPLAGTRPAVARMLALRAGNAAAVRVLRAPGGSTTEEPMPAPAQDPAPVAEVAPGPESAPLDEAEPMPAPAQDPAPVAEVAPGPESASLDESEPMSQPEVDVAPVSADGDAVASEPVDELAPYRAEMIRLIRETERVRVAAQAMVTDYATAATALTRAARPDALGEVPPSLAGKADQATAQYNAFQAEADESQADLQGLIGEGDNDFTPALDEREALSTGPEALAWLRRVGAAQGTYLGVAESRPQVLQGVVDAAIEFANIGKDLEQADYIAGVLAVADRAQQLASLPVAPRPDLSAPDATGTQHDSVSTGFAWADALNNSAAVVSSSLGLAYATVSGIAVFGTVSTGIGLAFAAIGILLAIRASISSGRAKARLAAVERYLSNDKAKDAAAFGKRQKSTKQKRQAALAVLGAVTVGVGVAALAVGSVATAGLALAITGIVIALAGLGVGIYKYFHRKRKRAKEAKAASAMADAYMEAAAAGDPESVQIVNVTNHGDRAALEAWCASQVANQRHHTAVELVKLVASSTPSERFNGTAVLEALDVNPQAVLHALESGNVDAAVGLVERKLSSW
ncbi:MAG: DUF3040 domain-containing protein [Dehalococcoidia bacterium]|nr:DUF3040 domain-containing protein [Dehalococcoidia bacterium]